MIADAYQLFGDTIFAVQEDLLEGKFLKPRQRGG